MKGVFIYLFIYLFIFPDIIYKVQCNMFIYKKQF